MTHFVRGLSVHVVEPLLHPPSLEHALSPACSVGVLECRAVTVGALSSSVGAVSASVGWTSLGSVEHVSEGRIGVSECQSVGVSECRDPTSLACRP